MANKEEQLESVAAKLGIGGYQRHVLLCTGPNCCTPEEGLAAWDALKQHLKQHNLGSGENACYRTKVGCLRICCHGPTMVVYPEGTWYHGMTVERIPRSCASISSRANPSRNGSSLATRWLNHAPERAGLRKRPKAAPRPSAGTR